MPALIFLNARLSLSAQKTQKYMATNIAAAPSAARISAAKSRNLFAFSQRGSSIVLHPGFSLFAWAAATRTLTRGGSECDLSESHS
jgi:hypothetical protein